MSLTGLMRERGFERFQEGLRAQFRTFDLEYELTYGEITDNPTMRLDFTSRLHMGRVNAWESGFCDLELLEIATGQIVLWEHYELQSEEEFHNTYSRLVIYMRDAVG